MVTLLVHLVGCKNPSVPAPDAGSGVEDDPTMKAARFETELIDAVNALRSEGADCGSFGQFGPVPPLEPQEALGRAARAHSRDMGTRGFFAHVNPDGADATARARAQGFTGVVAENLAWGQSDAASVVRAWEQNPEHCNAVMSTRFSSTGAGFSVGAAGKTFWTQVFGRP
jgi:uncharacterized protein YkwD